MVSETILPIDKLLKMLSGHRSILGGFLDIFTSETIQSMKELYKVFSSQKKTVKRPSVYIISIRGFLVIEELQRSF